MGNPLSTLFFALDADTHPSPTVYIYHAKESQIVTEDDKQKAHPFEIEQTKIFQSMGHSPGVAMQAGWHTVHRIRETNLKTWESTMRLYTGIYTRFAYL